MGEYGFSHAFLYGSYIFMREDPLGTFITMLSNKINVDCIILAIIIGGRWYDTITLYFVTIHLLCQGLFAYWNRRALSVYQPLVVFGLADTM